MRLVAGTALITRAVAGLVGARALGPDVANYFQIVLGVLLLAGLWTPVTGTLVMLEQIWRLYSHPGDPWIHILLGTLGGAVALVGPGAYSADARLFGWKRIDVRTRQARPQSPPDH